MTRNIVAPAAIRIQILAFNISPHFMKAIDSLLFEYLPIEVMHLLDGGIGHPGRPILTPEYCLQRFKLLLFCRVIKAHIWSLRILKFGWLQISETGGGLRQRGRAQGAKKPTATPL